MSSRRHSNYPSPTWRTTHKQRAATSVSIIFAQPLQGSPLRTAIDNLPSIGIDDSASFMSEMSRKRERRSSALDFDEADDPGREESVNGQSAVSRRGSFVSGVESTGTGVGPDDASTSQAPQVIDLTGNEPEVLVPAPAVLTESPKTASEPAFPDTPKAPIVSLPPPPPVSKFNEDQKPPAKKSSWFASFSRSKGTATAPAPQPLVEEQTKLPEDIPSQPVSSFLTTSVLSSTENNLTSGANLSGSGLDVTATAPPAITMAPEVEPAPPVVQEVVALPTQQTFSTANVSVLDDEVTSRDMASNSGPSQETAPPGETVPDPKPPTSSETNPPASRFMLRIPLLGRVKVPLDQAVSAANGNLDTKPVSSEVMQVISKDEPPAEMEPEARQSEEACSVISPASSSGTVEATHADPKVTEDITQENHSDAGATSALPAGAAPPTPESSNQTSTSSWWNYIGLGGTTAVVNPVTQAAPVGDSSSTVEETAARDDAGVTTVTPPISAEPPLTIIVSDEVEPPADDKPQPETVPPPNDKPQSILSQDTSGTQGSAWYSPWGWYNSSNAPTTSEPVPETTGPTQPPEITMTESEMVKVEALARDDHNPSTQSAPENVVATPSEDTPSTQAHQAPNPIESSISTYRSGWASFFLTRSLAMKAITEGDINRDENGMEVMDIDEDDGKESSEPIGVPASPRSAVSANGTTPAQQVAVSQSPTKSLTMPSSKQPQREPKKAGPVAPPLTSSESIRKETTKGTTARPASPAPSSVTAKKSGSSTPVPPKPQPPNLVLPTWSDTFHCHPRSIIPPPPPPPQSALAKTLSAFSGVFFPRENTGSQFGSAKGKERQSPSALSSGFDYLHFGRELPKAFDVLGQTLDPKAASGDCKVVVIGVAGWSPGAVTRTIAGGLPSSSSKFVNMACSALEKFEVDHGVKFKKITKIPLDGDGTISRKVSKVHAYLLENKEWVEDLHAADVILVATHSQGSIVSTHLLDRLIREGHILTPRNVDILNSTTAAIAPGGSLPAASAPRVQKICCLALCGIHLGPLRYLKKSSLLQPYIQYFENAAARELFDFQDTNSAVSKDYINALRTVMDHGSKMVYIASLNDQVVPIYSGLFTAASHPRILRALYIDGDAYHSSDFLSNLLVLLIRIRNTGLSDSGLLAHLSEATAGTLSGIGHSSAYEELATYSLAVNYLFLTNDGADVRTDLMIEPFNAANEQNDYEIPWSLRDLIADEDVAHLFANEFSQLRDAFNDWSPRTSTLRDIKRKLQPIQRLSSIKKGGSHSRL